MKWKILSEDQRFIKLKEKRKYIFEYEKEWHQYFAWLPTRISEIEMVWLQKIERRLEYPYRNINPSPWLFENWAWKMRRFEYREIENDRKI